MTDGNDTPLNAAKSEAYYDIPLKRSFRRREQMSPQPYLSKLPRDGKEATFKCP